MNDRYDSLLLDHQLCFPLYAAGKEIVRRYQPVLAALDLTYTQYITMMVLWEMGTVSAKALGERLYLDSGTLTPVLKHLEAKGYITRARSAEDERLLLCTATQTGMALREKALDVPRQMASCVTLTAEEAATLYTLLHKLLGR